MDKRHTKPVGKPWDSVGLAPVSDTDFRVVAEDAPVMLWLTNAEGKIVFTNTRWKKFVCDRSDNAPLGNDAWVSALHPDDLAPCMQIFHKAFL